MRDTFVMARLDQLRALADPLRLRMVEQLIAGDRSVAELAKSVEVPLTRAYHHVDLLLETGLIEQVDTVRRRGAPERRFRAVARRYTLHGSLLEMAPGPDPALEELLTMSHGILGGALEAVTEGLKSGRVAPGTPGRGLLLEHRVMRLSAAGFEALAAELPAWLDEFERRHRTARGGEFRLAAACYPTDSGPATRARSPKRKAATR